jgi:type II secretory pathway pseudopilin PulG
MRPFIRATSPTRAGRATSPARAGAGGPTARLRQEGGFTLLETLIASVVLIVGLMTLFGLLETSLKATAATRAREGATNLARQILEDAHTIPYGQLAPSAIVGELQAMHGLADASSAAGWQIVQRGITYTVAVSECSIDDPKDKYGKHENAFKENPFCADSKIEGTEDTQPEDFKRITVDVTWTATGRKPDVHQVETLTAAGEAPGLSASGLHLVAGTPNVGSAAEPIIFPQPASNSLGFEVSAPTGAVAMRWSLEGVPQSPAPVFSSGTTWTFSWPIPTSTVSDGTYEVSAQAIDATGVVGPPVSIQLTLARSVPAAVSGLKGGFNEIYVSNVKTKVVELEWKANTERNVIGYRVYDPSKALVCPASVAEGGLTLLSVSLSCVDMTPPSPGASNLTFAASAVYRNYKGELAEGPAGTLAIVGGPHAPRSLEAKKQSDGSVLLTWEKPESGGEPVSFYRIYRGSKNYTSRYDVVLASGSESKYTYTDTDATVEHEYWVTAVDANLTESEFPGLVKK